MEIVCDKPDDHGGEREAGLDEAARALIKDLNLPKEVTTREASEILGCCKHTVLQYLAEGLLEWRNAAPPSSLRPVYRFTVRSVLEIRLGYQRGISRSPQPRKLISARRRSAPRSDYQPKHLRRKKSPARHDADSATRS
jgi:hypothetical protein